MNGNELPEQVIFYRDGVDEGELDRIVKSELQQVQTGVETFFKSKGCETDVKVVFIVVTRNHGMRYFICDGGKWTNPQPGTVVATEVTYPNR